MTSERRPSGRFRNGGSKCRRGGVRARGARRRSEEHTSELQSRENLVCRLLLEKKKKQSPQRRRPPGPRPARPAHRETCRRGRGGRTRPSDVPQRTAPRGGRRQGPAGQRRPVRAAPRSGVRTPLSLCPFPPGTRLRGDHQRISFACASTAPASPAAGAVASPGAPCHSPSLLFFFDDTATTEIYTLSLHDALPI